MRAPTSSCFEIIKKWEGLHKKIGGNEVEAYLDPADIWTIGYGATVHLDFNRPVQPSDRITIAAAERWLEAEVQDTAEDVDRLCRGIPLTNGMFDALVSFTFNVGTGAFGESTLLKKLKSKDYTGASREFDRWVNITDGAIKRPLAGLVNRRNDEEKLFLRDGTSPSDAGDAGGGSPTTTAGGDESNVEVKPYKPAELPLQLRDLLLLNDIGEDCYILNCALGGLGFLRMGPQPNQFTDLTADALRLFQRREGLSRIDAKVGPETRRALENALKRVRDPIPMVEPGGDNYCRLTRTSAKNTDGLFICNLEFITKDGVGDTLKVNSGVPSTQDAFLAFDDPASTPGSLQPIPQSRYTIGDIEFASGVRNDFTVNWPQAGDGLGPVWVPIIKRIPDDRDAFGFHLDNNRATSPGSAGCVVTDTMTNLKKLVSLLRKYDPRLLVVDWGV